MNSSDERTLPEVRCESTDAHVPHTWYVRKGPIRAGRDLHCHGVEARRCDRDYDHEPHEWGWWLDVFACDGAPSSEPRPTT